MASQTPRSGERPKQHTTTQDRHGGEAPSRGSLSTTAEGRRMPSISRVQESWGRRLLMEASPGQQVGGSASKPDSRRGRAHSSLHLQAVALKLCLPGVNFSQQRGAVSFRRQLQGQRAGAQLPPSASCSTEAMSPRSQLQPALGHVSFRRHPNRQAGGCGLLPVPPRRRAHSSLLLFV